MSTSEHNGINLPGKHAVHKLMEQLLRFGYVDFPAFDKLHQPGARLPHDFHTVPVFFNQCLETACGKRYGGCKHAYSAVPRSCHSRLHRRLHAYDDDAVVTLPDRFEGGDAYGIAGSDDKLYAEGNKKVANFESPLPYFFRLFKSVRAVC